MQPPQDPPVFPLVVAVVMTAYLAAAALLLGADADEPAARAVVRLVWVLAGASALLTLCLGLRRLEWTPTEPREDWYAEGVPPRSGDAGTARAPGHQG